MPEATAGAALGSGAPGVGTGAAPGGAPPGTVPGAPPGTAPGAPAGTVPGAAAGTVPGAPGAVPAAGTAPGAPGVVPPAGVLAAWLSPAPDSGTTRRAPANCEDQYELRRSAIWTTSPVRGASRNMWLPTYMPTWSTSPPPIRKKTRSPSLRSLRPTEVPTVNC